MALDWITKNIYWTDLNLQTIEVVSANGQFRAALVTENITEPKSIVLDPRPGCVLIVCSAYCSYVYISHDEIVL